EQLGHFTFHLGDSVSPGADSQRSVSISDRRCDGPAAIELAIVIIPHRCACHIDTAKQIPARGKSLGCCHAAKLAAIAAEKIEPPRAGNVYVRRGWNISA